MRAPPPRWSILRAALAVAALYALVLQGVAGAAVAAGPPSAAHVLCAPDESGPTQPALPEAHKTCCVTVQACHGALPPLPQVTAIAWPRRRAVLLPWRPDFVAQPRAPPGIRSSPRAPPVV
ncbi:hypothetical protein [Methylobacterium sp. JK268]